MIVLLRPERKPGAWQTRGSQVGRGCGSGHDVARRAGPAELFLASPNAGRLNGVSPASQTVMQWAIMPAMRWTSAVFRNTLRGTV